MKDMASAPLRTISLILGIVLALLGMVSTLSVSGLTLEVSNPWFRGGLIVAGAAIAALALFRRNLFEDSQSEASPIETLSQQSETQRIEAVRPALPSGLYRWDEPRDLVFSTLLNKATRLSVSGRTAVNILSRNETEVRAFLRGGGKLRLLVLDPSSADKLQIYTEPTADLRENLSKGLKYASALGCSFPGRVEIRTTPRPPTMGVVWVEGTKTSPLIREATGVIQVKLYLDHSVTGAGRPNIAVLSNDPWYETMTDDFESKWKSASIHADLERS